MFCYLVLIYFYSIWITINCDDWSAKLFLLYDLQYRGESDEEEEEMENNDDDEKETNPDGDGDGDNSGENENENEKKEEINFIREKIKNTKLIILKKHRKVFSLISKMLREEGQNAKN